MPRTAPRRPLIILLLPLIVAGLALVSAWPLYEASVRLRSGESTLFGPIPSPEQRLQRELRELVPAAIAEDAAGILAEHMQGAADRELSRQRPSAEEAALPEDERERLHAERLAEQTRRRLIDLRDDLRLFALRHRPLGDALSLDGAEDVEMTGEGTLWAHVARQLTQLTKLEGPRDDAIKALLEQIASAVAVDEALVDEVIDELAASPHQQAAELRMALATEWPRERVAAVLLIQGLLALGILGFLLRSRLGGVAAACAAMRAHLLGHLLLLVAGAAGLGILITATRFHFGEGNEGWALALMAAILRYGWPLLVLWLLLAASHVWTARAKTLRALGWQGIERGPGDQLLESLRGGGADPELAMATRRSVLLHLLLLIGPILLSFMPGCWGRDSYKLPSGSGEPAAAMMVQVVEEEQEKEELILAEDSPIIFERATIDDSDAMQQLVQQSRRTYEATAHGAAGAMGIGGGEEGGFLGAGGPVRFIRIRHRGEGWDDGMGSGHPHYNADANFLRWLARASSLETESRGEAMTIEQIYHRFPRGERPPFVYLTGRQLNLSNNEREILRRLCMEGTLLFADAETPRFHRDFQREMRQVFPDRQLIHISDEDPIMRIPNVFPNGLQSNQWHGPPRAMGIRHQRQLIVFYHPGDANDMWKDNAHMVPREIRDTAFWIGQNIVYYSFRRYHERYGGGRR